MVTGYMNINNKYPYTWNMPCNMLVSKAVES